MILILCILAGIAMEQHIKIAGSPELMAFITSSWALAGEKVPPVASLAVTKIKQVTATNYPRLGETV